MTDECIAIEWGIWNDWIYIQKIPDHTQQRREGLSNTTITMGLVDEGYLKQYMIFANIFILVSFKSSHSVNYKIGCYQNVLNASSYTDC